MCSRWLTETLVTTHQCLSNGCAAPQGSLFLTLLGRLGVHRGWEGTAPGQLTPTDQMDVQDHNTSCSAQKKWGSSCCLETGWALVYWWWVVASASLGFFWGGGEWVFFFSSLKLSLSLTFALQFSSPPCWRGASNFLGAYLPVGVSPPLRSLLEILLVRKDWKWSACTIWSPTPFKHPENKICSVLLTYSCIWTRNITHCWAWLGIALKSTNSFQMHAYPDKLLLPSPCQVPLHEFKAEFVSA